MMTLLRLLIAALLLAALPARATFHLWQMSELYSNADGSVQFLELRALTGGQEFLGGHTLDSQGPNGVTNTLNFSDLQGDTSNRTMLVGTVGFSQLNVVQPDFIVPNGFFFKGGGTLIFGEGADRWTYPALPTPPLSLNRDGTTSTNSPKNFSGATGSIATVTPPPPTPFNVHGLWWNDPDGSQGGWGINLVQQNTSLFMSWFTYDTDNSNMWLFMSNTTKTATNTYTGDIFRNTGPAFSSATWNSAAVAPVKVGTGTFIFTDADHGSFVYTVNNVSQVKQIKRFVYANPVPVCNETGSIDGTVNYSDLWWRAGGTESGWGLNVIHQGDTLFLSWFTYDAAGKGMWIFGSSITKATGTTYSGDLFRNTGPAFSSAVWNANLVVPVKVGTVTLTFTDNSHATFNYTVDAVTQSKAIERFAFDSPTTSCRFP